MANREHVDRLLEGVPAWNAWRDRYPEQDIKLIDVDLTKFDLRGANLAHVNLHRARLRESCLVDANLLGAQLTDANLISADLTGAELRGATLFRANLFAAKLTGADLRDTELRFAHLRKSNLAGAKLAGIQLRGNDMRETNLTSADLTNAELHEIDLRGAILCDANLNGADLNRANLAHADLSGARLRETNLVGTNLFVANLTGADLSSSNLSGANLHLAKLRATNLRNADLSKANLLAAKLDGADLREAELGQTVFGNIDLTNVIGLETCAHFGPSVIDIQTLERSGPLPLAFLRGVGLPDAMIDYLPSLLSRPIQYFSCFISYSHQDEEFVQRMHADLQNKGVRCWFAPHDLPIGSKILDTIDEAIRLRDKVLIVLSEQSIGSDWVEDEVKTAFEEERKRGQTVLFPIRLDDSIMETREAWAAKLRADRHIGDFRQWKVYDQYLKTLDRVLRDLTTGRKPKIVI